MTEKTKVNPQNQDLQTLVKELKHYLQLQKRYLALDAVEKMTRLISAVATVAVCMMLGAMVLFFTLYALAKWLGGLLDNDAIGFLIVAVILLILGITFYSHRQTWVTQPLARLMAQLFLDKEEEEEPINE